MRIKLFLYFLIRLSVVLMLNSCSGDSSCVPEPTKVFLSQFNETAIPYDGLDTLVFINNSGDTAVCVGQGKETFFERIHLYGVDCGQVDRSYESRKIQFSPIKNSFRLFVTIRTPESQWTNDNYLKWYLNDLFLFQYQCGDMCQPDDKEVFHDSITIRGKIYFDVKEIKLFKGIFMMSKSKGLIQFPDGGVTWTRVN